MTTPTTPAEAVEQAALSPRRVKVGPEEAESHPIPDLIKADEFAKTQTAAGRNHQGIRFTKIVPPGGG